MHGRCHCSGSRGGYRRETGRETLVLLAVLLDDAPGHEILELLVGAQPQHLFPTACSVTGPEILVDHFKKLFELERAFRRQNADQFFGDKIRNTT